MNLWSKRIWALKASIDKVKEWETKAQRYKIIFIMMYATLENEVSGWFKMVTWLSIANKDALFPAKS